LTLRTGLLDERTLERLSAQLAGLRSSEEAGEIVSHLHQVACTTS
jgi:hypothetical protein